MAKNSNRFESGFPMGEYVYLSSDPEKEKRRVLAITFNINGGHIYTLAIGDYQSAHFEEEMELWDDTVKLF